MYFIIMYSMAIYQNIREVYKTWKGIYAQSKSKAGLDSTETSGWIGLQGAGPERGLRDPWDSPGEGRKKGRPLCLPVSARGCFPGSRPAPAPGALSGVAARSEP